MAKGRKQQTAAWMVFLQGLLAALGIYLAGQFLLALLLVKGTLPEGSAFPVVAVLCVAAVTCGGLLTVRRSPWGTLPAGLLTAGLFIVVLLLVGLSCWESVTWLGHGGILLLCALAGGLLAGLLGSRRKRGGKRKRK